MRIQYSQLIVVIEFAYGFVEIWSPYFRCHNLMRVIYLEAVHSYGLADLTPPPPPTRQLSDRMTSHRSLTIYMCYVYGVQ